MSTALPETETVNATISNAFLRIDRGSRCDPELYGIDLDPDPDPDTDASDGGQ